MPQSSYITLPHQWIFMWAFILLLAFVIQPTHSAGTERELLGIIDAPDSDSFWDTGMRLCDIDENGDCHSGDYALSILRYGSGGLAAAVVCILFFVLFMPIRFLCNGFGGPDMIDIRSYTKKEIISIKVVAVLVLIPIVIGIGIGFKTNSDISNSVEEITYSLVTSGDDILHTLENARDMILTYSNNSAYARVTINNAVTAATEITDKLHNVHDTTNKYDGVREGLMIAGAVCCIIIVVAGVICALFNLRVIAMVIGLFSILILTIIWLSFGAHLVAGKFAYDVCVDIDLLIEEDGNNNNTSSSVFKTGALANLWECNNNTDLINLQILVNNSISTAASAACTARSQICYSAVNNTGDPNWNCSTSPACGLDTLILVTDSDHMIILDGGEPRSVAECAVNCTSSSYRNISLAILSSVSLYSNYTSLYYDDVLPIISCQLAIDVLKQVKAPLCDVLFDSVYGVAVSNLIVGIFYVPFIVSMIMGYKRFRSFNV